MKIFDLAGTPNAARIRIVAAEKGLDEQIEYVSVDLIGAEQKQPAFLAMNPVGKTPVLLLDDGFAISECTAITEYLDNLDGNPVLTGRTPREKAEVHMMQRRVEIMLLDPIDDYFHYGTKGARRKTAPLAHARLAPCPRMGPAPRCAGAGEYALVRGASGSASLPRERRVLDGRHHPVRSLHFRQAHRPPDRAGAHSSPRLVRPSQRAPHRSRTAAGRNSRGEVDSRRGD